MVHRVSPAAIRDLDAIWLHTAESGNVNAANRFADELTGRFYLIAQHPRIGRIRDELRLGLRSLLVRDYIVFYRLRGEEVVILRVLHGRRDVEALLGTS